MSEEIHRRAEQLIARERIEGLSEAERDWLSAHFEECARCSESARATDQALRALRTVTISLPTGLSSRTQFRVRLRAQELREREPRRRALWVACAISWVFGILSAPYVWRLFAWFGEQTGVPKLVWELGFGLWWAIPALFIAIVLLMEKARQDAEQDWMRPGR
jgi:hypothetical protein